MSHEDLALLWSLLDAQQDVTLSIREVTGQHALDSTLHFDDPETRTRSLLNYAVELLVIFDFVGASHSLKTNIESNAKATKYIHLSLGHLIRQIRIEDLEKDPQVARLSIHVYVRAITSAICALCIVEATDLQKEAGKTVTAAQNLVQQLSDQIPHSRPLKELCIFLSTHYLGYIRSAQDERVSALWHGLCRAASHSGDQQYSFASLADGPDRSEIIDDCIGRIVRTKVDTIDRITAVLEIYHTYQKSEAFIVRGCAGTNGDSKIMLPGSEVENSAIVLETRSLIQEHLMNATMDSSTDQWAQCFGPCLLFMPGLEASCALDRCKCAFNERDGGVIVGMRRRRVKILQTSLQRLHTISLLNCPLESIQSTLKAFGNRITPSGERPKVQASTNVGLIPIDQPIHVKEQKLVVHSTIPRRPVHKSLANGRSMSFPNIDEARELHFSTPVSGLSSPQILPGSRHNSFTSDLLSRPGSTTTGTSSSREDGDQVPDNLSPHPCSPVTSNDSHKIVVDTTRIQSIESPFAMEKNYPEVAIRSPESDTMSILSEYSIPMTVLPAKASASKSRFGKLLRGKKDSPSAFVQPKFRFFASAKHILLWTKHGGGIIDPNQPADESFIPIHEPDIVHAAGGTNKFVIMSRTHENYRVSIYRLGDSGRPVVFDIAKGPGAIDLSPNDRYLALKYVKTLLLYDLQQPGVCVTHKLPSHDNSRPGYGNHLISFAQDSSSFMAATRFQPEKVYTYWAPCAQSSNVRGTVACSTAPFGHVDDHGLTSLIVQSPTPRSYANGFLSTFTEKGQPVLLNMHPDNATSRSLRDHKERMGTRIHSAAMSVDPNNLKTNLVLVSQSNDVFWVTDLFGRDTDSHQISVLKRPKSLKNEVQVAMSDVNEASIFWVDKTTQKGVLVKVGRGGGKAQPVYYRLDVEPMCSG